VNGIRLVLAVAFFNFVSQTGARVVLTLYALEQGAPPSSVGVIGGLLFLFPLLLSWPVGILADRKGARSLLLYASAWNAASLLIPLVVRDISALYAAAALNGLSLAVYHVTLQNLTGSLSRPEERARNFGNFSLIGSLTNFIGALLAGFSIDHAGHAAACVAIAIPALIAFLFVLAWGRAFPPATRAAARESATASPGLLRDRSVLRVLAASVLVQLGSDLFQFYLPIYGHSIGLSASAIGGMLATLAVAAFTVRLFLARLVRDHPPEKLLACAFSMGAAGYLLVPFFTHPVALATVAFCFGLGMGLGIPLTVILTYSRSTEGRSGQALGLRLTFSNFTRVAGPMIFGAVGTALGVPPVFWIGAGLMAAGGLAAMKRDK
jgi:predicted MFS family arabinose efflux permease